MRTFNLEEIAEAHWHMEAKKKKQKEKGKIIINVIQQNQKTRS